MQKVLVEGKPAYVGRVVVGRHVLGAVYLPDFMFQLRANVDK